MDNIRTDSYQEMRVILQDRLDSIVGERSDEEQESGARKWGRRAAKAALGAGLTVGAVYGGRKALRYAANELPKRTMMSKGAAQTLNKTARRAENPEKTARAFGRLRRMRKMQGPQRPGGNRFQKRTPTMVQGPQAPMR